MRTYIYEKDAVDRPTRSFRTLRLLAAVLSAILASQHVAVAATYYVSPTGSNGNAGTDADHPWQSIAYAEQTAASGSTVYLMSGEHGTLTIDRADNSGRTGWHDAITFAPLPGATPNITRLAITGDCNRYLIFDSVAFDYPDTDGQVGTVDIIRILAGGFIKFVNCTIHGKLGKDANGEYADTYSTRHCAYIGSYYDPPVHDITFDGCDIGYTAQFGVAVNGPVSGPILVKNCEVHHFGASGLRHDGRNAVKTTYEGNRVHTQVHVWTSDYSTKHHGSGLHISGDNCDFIGNRVWCAGTSAAVRAYQGAVGGGFDGGVEVRGSYDSEDHRFVAGESLSQGNARGKFLRSHGSPATVIEIARATDDTTFNTSDPIVSDSDPTKIWRPTSIGNVRAWGGRRKVTIKNNLVYQGANTYYKMELHDLGPGCEVCNNTVIGSHVAATGWNYFWYALLNAPPPYYEGDIATLTFCNNVFVGHVDGFPSGCTATGNICFGYQNGKTQAQLDALFPGNKVYNWSASVNTNVPLFTTSGAFFVGGSAFESYGFQQPADGAMGIEVANSPGDLGDCFALAEGSDAAGFGNATHATATDILGRLRDIPPDAGCYEIQSDGSGNHPPVLDAIGDRTTTTGQVLAFQVTASDADGDPIALSASNLPSGASFSNGQFTWTPTAAQVGNHQVTFAASDGQTQDSETITITVTSATANAPPVLSAIGGKSVREGERLAFSITATDPDGDPLTYSATNLPNGASFSGQSFSWTPGYDQAGNHQVTFVASDGQAQDTETVTVSVTNVNRAPVLSDIGDRSVDENSLLSFSISAADPDGDSVAYSASGLPSGAGFSNRTFSWTPTSAQIGVYDVTFIASDGQLQDTETITLAVVTSGADVSAPTVTSLSPEADAIQVSLNHLIRLHVNDAGQGVDADSIVIRLDDQVIYEGDTSLHTSAYGRCSRTGTKHDYRFTYQPDKPFDCDRIVNVEVDASDFAGNVMNTYSYSFLTEMRAFGSNYMASSAAGGTEPKGRPAIVSDAAGNIWAVWHAGAAGSRDVCIAALTAGAHAFGTSVRLTAETADQCNPDVALAGDGSLFVVWQDYQRGNWDIFASVCSDGLNWSRPIQITDSEGNETNPVIVIDQQSPRRAYVAWQDDRNGNADIYVAVSTSAFSESTITRVTTSSADQADPDIAVDGEDTVVIVWTDMRNGNADIYGASSSSGTWANAPVVTGSGAQTSPALAADPSASALHLLWVDDRPGNRDIYYAWSDGLPTSSLTGSSIIDDSSAADQLAPAIACVDSLGVFPCWEDLRHANLSGEDSDLFMADLGTGAARTNVLIGDGGTNSSQSEPAMGIDGYGNPYVVWTDGRDTQSEVYYAATTFINPVPLDSEEVAAAVGATIGTDPAAIASKNDVSIIVPAGACQFDARVTISEILNPPVLPVECLGSYDFGPSGIDFDTPVTVTIPYEFAGGAGSAKPYWYDSLTGALSQQGITEVENIVISSTLNALRFKTTHFTPFYLVAGDVDTGGLIGDTSIAGGCSISVTGSSSAKDLLVPYGIIAVVMLVLRRSDRRKRMTLGHSRR